MSSNREGQGTQKSQKSDKEKDRDNQQNQQQVREHGHDNRVQQREKGPKPPSR